MAKSLEELEIDLRAVTSRLSIIDSIVAAAKIGVSMEMVFRCNHSQLHFPSDYVKEWGKLYGIGLGPDPVSEVLDTDYDIDPPPITPDIDRIEQIMHPVGNTRVQVDLALVRTEDLDMAIIAEADHKMMRRGPILYQKQLKNPKSKVRIMRVAWEGLGR